MDLGEGLGDYIFHFLLLSLTDPSVADKIGIETINLSGANFVTLTYKVIRLQPYNFVSQCSVDWAINNSKITPSS